MPCEAKRKRGEFELSHFTVQERYKLVSQLPPTYLKCFESALGARPPLAIVRTFKVREHVAWANFARNVVIPHGTFT